MLSVGMEHHTSFFLIVVLPFFQSWRFANCLMYKNSIHLGITRKPMACVSVLTAILFRCWQDCCECFGHDWDRHLSYVLYAYHVSVQESTRESPFFLLYGRNPTLLEALSRERSPYVLDLDDYKTELVAGLSRAWQTVL